jgi:chromosome segregation ATPase
MLQDNFDAKIHELKNFLAAEQEDQRSGQTLANELRREFQLVTQRLGRAEASAQQVHALMVNETEQAVQLRDGLMRELVAVQAKLAGRQARDKQVDGAMEELNAHIDEMNNRLSQEWATLASRDADVIELRSQVQNFAQQLAAKSAGLLTVSRTHAPVAVPAVPTSANARKDTAAVLTPATEASDASPLIQSYDAGADSFTDQNKQLQQRLSADIERVRAELRKRAGVSR